jgi:hypothetical protein
MQLIPVSTTSSPHILLRVRYSLLRLIVLLVALARSSHEFESRPGCVYSHKHYDSIILLLTVLPAFSLARIY